MPDRSSQTQAPLLDVLQQYLTDRHVPFYMPGHKRGQGIDPEFLALLGRTVFQLDLPELPGLEEKIIAAEALAAQAYGADRSWFLTNGSTQGVQAMILATCRRGDKLILGRNCHRSAIGGLILSGAIPIYVSSAYSETYHMDLGVHPATLEQSLGSHPDAKAVLLVSPNYFGVGGALTENIQLCHDRSLPILIDSAHGAHLGFHPQLPPSPIHRGADLVVQSTHKTATSLTQSSLLHCQGDRVDRDRVAEALGVLASTSPNLLLLASLDVSRRQMALEGKERLAVVIGLSQQLRQYLQTSPYFTIPDPQQIPDLDITRITLVLHQGTGYALDTWLCNHPSYPVIGEMPTLHHLVLALSMGNTPEDIDRLGKALTSTSFPEIVTPVTLPPLPPLPPQSLSPQEAYFAPGETVTLPQGIGHIARSLLCPYPPGIPLLCPGEILTPEVADYLTIVVEAGGVVQGLQEGRISIVK